MMIDRDLLELAAKSAGYTVHGSINEDFYVNFGEGLRGPWNPLNDDGDAMRLLALLKVDISFEAYGCVMAGHDAIHGGAYDAVVEDANHGGLERLAATRRAIVMAAAEIGKRMP